MDSYFAKETINLSVEELYGIGVASMFIASKYEDVPMKLQSIYT